MLADGTSLIPKMGNQTQKTPPKTSVNDNKVSSAAGKLLDPMVNNTNPKHTKKPKTETTKPKQSKKPKQAEKPKGTKKDEGLLGLPKIVEAKAKTIIAPIIVSFFVGLVILNVSCLTS